MSHASTRYWLACLSMPPGMIFMGDGDLTHERLEWAQPVDRWTMLYYRHGNVVTVNAQTFAVQPDDVVFFAPGVKAAHAVLGENTHHLFLTCDLPGDDGTRAAIPTHAPSMARVYPDWRRAADRVADDRGPSRAFAWNLFWGVAQGLSVVREDVELYAAEAWIFRNLDRKFSVRDIADAANTSQRHLLRAFRHEHRMTIQEYVRQKRVQEAARLLATTTTPIKEIAVQVGIPDLHQFNKTMREETGSSPRAFRELGSR